MTVLVASDLDRTLIYSPRSAHWHEEQASAVCVEVHDGEPAAFMTKRAAVLLADLSAIATVMPVTTRVPAQYRRVVLPMPLPRFAVLSNGGMLLVDGAPDAAWAARVATALAASAPLSAVWSHLAAVCDAAWTDKLRLAEDLFAYAVIRRDTLPDGFVGELTEWAVARGWRVSLQGRKLYLVPDGLTKQAAVAEVRNRIGADLVLAAGDSLLDADFLAAADRAIRPRHGELHEQQWLPPNCVRTSRRWIRAGEEIVSWFTEQAQPSVM